MNLIILPVLVIPHFFKRINFRINRLVDSHDPQFCVIIDYSVPIVKMGIASPRKRLDVCLLKYSLRRVVSDSSFDSTRRWFKVLDSFYCFVTVSDIEIVLSKRSLRL